MTAFALLVRPGPIAHDAVSYVAMVRGPASAVSPPYCYRIAAPLLARAWPGSAEGGLAAVTFVSLALAALLWFRMGRRLGLSNRALLLAALAMASTQGFMGFFNNPYLTDGAGLLGLSAAWAAWALDAFLLCLPVLLLGPLFRETVAPLAALWFVAPRTQVRRYGHAALALGVAAAPLLWVRTLPVTAPPGSSRAALLHALAMKGVLANLGDVLASYHALWWVAGLGFARAPRERLRAVLPPLFLMLAVGLGLSLLGNTVRMLTLALPFMAYGVAELFQVFAAADARGAILFAGVLGLGIFVWYPTRLLGDALSAHRIFQYLFAVLALVATGLVQRRMRSLAPTSSSENHLGGH